MDCSAWLSLHWALTGRWHRRLLGDALVTPLGRAWRHLPLQGHRDSQGTVQALLITARPAPSLQPGLPSQGRALILLGCSQLSALCNLSWVLAPQTAPLPWQGGSSAAVFTWAKTCPLNHPTRAPGISLPMTLGTVPLLLSTQPG